MYDILIIGGGPAGLTAATYACRAGKSVLVLEKDALGGQITWSPKVENYPAIPAISGMDLGNLMAEQAMEQGAEVEIDEALLKQIAETTGGRYFRATDNTKLAEIYSEINQMEKARTTVDSFPVYKELFPKYALAALLLLLAELLVKLFLRRLP